MPAQRRIDLVEFDAKARQRIVSLYTEHDVPPKLIAERYGRRDASSIKLVLRQEGVYREQVKGNSHA